MSAPEAPSAAEIIVATRRWVERAVIGLNLCPFAKAVHVKGQVRYAVSAARTADTILADLETELQLLRTTPADQVDNTLLILPQGGQEFSAFLELLRRANAVLRQAGLVGEIQIASFHPQYQFADTDADDISNYTNRAPYPTLHLLREASMTRAVQAFPAADAIYQTNIETMRKLGRSGWEKLGLTPAASSPKSDGPAEPRDG